MARKESVTKDIILETALALAKEEGIGNVTARKLAAKIGCSTQPIFWNFKTLGELKFEVIKPTIAPTITGINIDFR